MNIAFYTRIRTYECINAILNSITFLKKHVISNLNSLA